MQRPPFCHPLPCFPPEERYERYGVAKIVDYVDTPDQTGRIVQYADGTQGYIANGFIPDVFGVGQHNGPRYSPFSSGARGDISGSEGMDAPNFWFNNSDNGASF